MPQSHATPQQMFRCVQCDSFVEHSSDALCPSHCAESHTLSDTGLVWSPCSNIGCAGCISQPHCQTAHADYPYSSFYASVNTLLDTQKTFTVVSAGTSLAVFGLTDSSHTQPNHLFLYVTPAGRDHPLQRLLFFSPDQLAVVALRASMSVMYQDTSKENILTAVNLTDDATKNTVEATWIANSIGGIIGIQISCKAVPMSSEPAVTNVYISQDEALQFGLFGVNVLSTYDTAPSPAHAKSNLKHLRRIGDGPIRSGLPRATPSAAMAEFHVLACVQCGADFIESENFSYSCRYHKLEAGKCCLKGNIACASSAHRSEHHTEYPYAAYDSYLKEFFRFDHEMFGSVQSQDVSYEPVVLCSISVGVTLASHATAPNQFFIFYKCGAESNSQHLMLYSKDELMDSALDVEPVIARYEDSGSFVEALWIIENGNIIGVQMHAKSATMQTPSISRVLFDFDHSKVPNLTTVSILSESHFGEYALPKNLRNDAYKSLPASSKTFLHHDADALILGIPRPRPPEKFQAIAMKACPLKISFVSVDCFRSNKALGGDQFLIVADIINVSNEPIQIHEFNCWWKSRRDGDSEWSLAKISEDSMSRSFDGWSQINGNKWATLKLFIDVGQAGVARLGSILFDVELLCVGGSSVSLTMEHTADQVYQIPDAETEQLNYIILESPLQHTTLNVEVNRKPRLDLLSVSVLGHVHKITLEAARRAVIIAERNPDLGGLVQIVSDCRDEYMCVLKVYGLVDVGCRRVYAVRVDVNFEGASAVRYFPIDEYGDALALDPVVGKSVIEASCALLGLEGYEPTEGIVFREQELLEFAPRVVPPIGVAGPIIEKPAPPVASVDTIEQAVLNLLESRLAEFVAKITPAPPTITVNGVSGVDEKLDLILAKLGAMDARMTVIETQQEAQAKHVSNQLVAVVARVENTAAANSVKDRALQKTLEDVRVALTTRQTTFEELVALDSLAERLESVGIDADELTSGSTIQDSELSALDALAKRLESIGAHADELTSSVHDMVRSATPEAISAVDAKLEKVAASLEVWDARMDKMESLTVLPDLILKSLEQIEMRHAEFDSHAFSRQNADVTDDPSQRQREFGAKLNELRQSVEMLPQAYKAALEISLEKQTDYILASIEGRPVRVVEEGRPTSPPATPPAAERTGGGNNGLKSNRLSQIRMSIPAVPNMGIASGISKLSGMVGRQGATSNPDSPNAVTENVTLLSDPQ
ncbi:hypothetical protein HDU78_011715 [Chytriomyces hyalinus]|nr:hypothetical protein HDU78_011715 [Chytriomyces hyalinus]